MQHSRLVVSVSFGVLLRVSMTYTLAGRTDMDFLSIYAGTRLVGTPDLYSVEHAHEIQRSLPILRKSAPSFGRRFMHSRCNLWAGVAVAWYTARRSSLEDGWSTCCAAACS